jgi:CheY-like chemotaxis protein
VKAVQDKHYDLVLMDIQMPTMDGLTATRHIRALDPPMRDVPIIAMTANVLPQQVEEFRSAGMADHIGKPFKRDELYGVIERWARSTNFDWTLAEAS